MPDVLHALPSSSIRRSTSPTDGVAPSKHNRVAVLPQFPHDKEDEGADVFSFTFVSTLGWAPLGQPCVPVWYPLLLVHRHAYPCPYLSRKNALGEYVVYGLLRLVAKRASVLVVQPTPC